MGSGCTCCGRGNTMRSPRFLMLGMLGLAVLALGAEKKAPDAADLARARQTVKMLDDLYKTAVVSITTRYVEDQAITPAASVAKDVFAAMHQKGWHHARLLDATGKPKNKENLPSTAFEKKAVDEIKGGKTYYEEIG